ncbi:SusC/RagA family TonB-linked outer membrane protein [Limibacter armeniacum]|uniref:SusC/RagA family TonB-linked outer membrane protein n=1 Tax=Limibacter armeniacum TaxID=466084 RepID=UPI002FE6B97A
MKKIQLILLLLTMVPTMLFAQERSISGTVTSGLEQEPLPGVSVIIEGSAQGTVTDLEGKFKLNAKQGDVLVFKFVGYKIQTQTVGPNNSFDISLEEDVTSLDEVVVSGLASSIKRSNLANAVGTVDAAQLAGTTSQPTMDGALYGKITGVNITASSGAPGGGMGIRLRGVSSIKGNNQPLFIIDGIYLNNAEIPSGLRFASGANRGNEENSANRIADLDPTDIESIEVLKGASAAAIYGTRANAGVIIITTKKGKAGKTKINFSQDVGVNTIQRYMGVRNFTEESVRATYGDAEVEKFKAAQAAGKIYNYEEELYGEKGLITNTKLSLSGGNDKTSFFIAGSMRDEEGIVKNTGFERNSLRANINHQLSDAIKLGLSTNYVNTFTRRGTTGNENEGGLSYGYNLAFTRPWAELHPDENGNYPANPNFAGNMLFVRDKVKNEDRVNRIMQGANLEIKLLQNSTTSMKAKLNGGLDFFMNETYVYVPEDHGPQIGTKNGFVGVGKNKFRNLNYQAFMVFDKFLMDNKLSLSTQAGISYLNFNRDLVYNQTTQLIPGQENLTHGGAKDIIQTQEVEEEFGIVLQEEVNYDDKIIGTLGVRMDKSSLNGDPNEYYPFLKTSLAVNIANFDFWSVDAMNVLKVRGAYGETGTSAGYGSLFTPLVSTVIDGMPGTVIRGNRGTPDLIPETSSEMEFGLDMAWLDNRISLEASYYSRDVNDLLFDRALESSSGYTSQVINDADINNQGIELGLTVDAVNKENFRWVSTTNFWKNKSKVTRLGVPSFPPPGNGFGLGLGTFYMEEGASVTQLAQSVDGEVVKVGDAEPDFQMSFTNNITFLKNFDFSFLVHWKQGGENLNLTKLLTDLGGTTVDLDTEAGQNRSSFIEPAGYVRLREVALYYRIPKTALSGVFGDTVERVKLGVSGRNLWTKTDYSGYDPEVSVNGSNVISSGLDVTPFPSSKQLYFHLNVAF